MNKNSHNKKQKPNKHEKGKESLVNEGAAASSSSSKIPRESNRIVSFQESDEERRNSWPSNTKIKDTFDAKSEEDLQELKNKLKLQARKVQIIRNLQNSNRSPSPDLEDERNIWDEDEQPVYQSPVGEKEMEQQAWGMDTFRESNGFTPPREDPGAFTPPGESSDAFTPSPPSSPGESPGGFVSISDLEFDRRSGSLSPLDTTPTNELRSPSPNTNSQNSSRASSPGSEEKRDDEKNVWEEQSPAGEKEAEQQALDLDPFRESNGFTPSPPSSPREVSGSIGGEEPDRSGSFSPPATPANRVKSPSKGKSSGKDL